MQRTMFRHEIGRCNLMETNVFGCARARESFAISIRLVHTHNIQPDMHYNMASCVIRDHNLAFHTRMRDIPIFCVFVTIYFLEFILK